MSKPTAVDAALLSYFTGRVQAEAGRVRAVLSAMTPRERALVREVAIMANVRALPPGERPAPDSEVVADVIGACLHMDDLYPTIARLERTAGRRKQRQEIPDA